MFCDKLTEKAIVLSDNPLAKTKNGNIAGIKRVVHIFLEE